eukprot:TRINITY_DN23398_c0_g1_i1.p1 TRINITY_DN23398_c0_g1~~TRINITY_DN23398_c0_g1_i1.p1  ORF type:complete len:390 (-),score=38.31 TRINITY_DN23398_c0_g1_i1:988-2157(-)
MSLSQQLRITPLFNCQAARYRRTRTLIAQAGWRSVFGGFGISVSGRARAFKNRSTFHGQAREVYAAISDVEVEASGGGFTLPQDALPEGLWERLVVGSERSFNVFATGFVVSLLDLLYSNRPYARFYVLETIARVPYFAFMSVLHMYETFGWWRRADYIKVHFAESWNELHHLLIMEALGGDRNWIDRFLAQHIAVAYYFVTCLMYLLSPRMAYHFSECVETHAYETYDKFVSKNAEELKLQPAPEVAVRYYTEGDLYMYDEFQTAVKTELRRPKIENLLDVFCAVRDDEKEHCKTMRACQTSDGLQSPHRDFVPATPSCSTGVDQHRGTPTPLASQLLLAPAECSGLLECAVTAKSYAQRMDATLADATLAVELSTPRPPLQDIPPSP